MVQPWIAAEACQCTGELKLHYIPTQDYFPCDGALVGRWIESCRSFVLQKHDYQL